MEGVAEVEVGDFVVVEEVTIDEEEAVVVDLRKLQ